MYTFGSSGSRQLWDASNEPREILMKSGEPEWILCAREGFKAFKSYHLISRVYYSIIAGTRVHYGSIIMLNYWIISSTFDYCGGVLIKGVVVVFCGQ